MDKASTIYDVAALAGVSIATVSFTYGRPEKVSASTREAVHRAAEQLAYVPSAAARGLAKGRTGILGLCSYEYRRFSFDHHRDGPLWVDDLQHYPIFIDEVQRGVQLQSWREGYSLLVRGSTEVGDSERTESVLNDLATRVDGLAVFPMTVPMALLQVLAKRIPVVAISEAPEDLGNVSFVTVDNFMAMGQMIDHLLTFHHFDDFEFVGSGSVDIDRRFAGFQSALVAAGVPVPTEPLGGTGRSPHAHQVHQVMDAVIRGRALPDVFVCATDQHAAVVLESLQRAGIGVPDQVAVTGFDGLLLSRYLRPSLTTVRQPMQEMGEAAANVITDSWAGPRSAPGRTTLPTTLVLGESCGCRSAPETNALSVALHPLSR